MWPVPDKMARSASGMLLAAALALPLLLVKAALAWQPARLLTWASRGRPRRLPLRLSPALAVRIVEAAARRLPFGCTCLEQACAVLLLSGGEPARLVLGVTRPDDTFRAHAWIEHEGRIILGAAAAAGLTPLVGGPAARRTTHVPACRA